MRFLNIVLFLAAVAVIFFLGAQSDPSGTASVKDPNPMKANAEQFARMNESEPRLAIK